MKKYYEEVSKTRLVRRMPVIIRLDGKAFHTFTRGMKKPFDEVFNNSMQQTMEYLCKNIQGCVLGYTQSDEITLVLKDNPVANLDYTHKVVEAEKAKREETMRRIEKITSYIENL